MSKKTDDHLSRIIPIVGPHLQQMRVAVVGFPQANPLVSYLAASGVQHWVWVQQNMGQENGLSQLQTQLQNQHSPALNFDIQILATGQPGQVLPQQPLDLLIMVNVPQWIAQIQPELIATTPVLAITPPMQGQPGQAIYYFRQDSFDLFRQRVNQQAPTNQIDRWGWAVSAPLLAGLARAILLRETVYHRADLEQLWQQGVRAVTLGDQADPCSLTWHGLDQQPQASTPSLFQTPQAKRGNILIAGLGSLGSIAATQLAHDVSRLVIADPGQVTPVNPIRQAYPIPTIGQAKVTALQTQLQNMGQENVVTINQALHDEEQIAQILTRYDISTVLITTGTMADFAIARACRKHNIPHGVGRCYPRAKYWEAMLITGQTGPALSDLRGHLQAGPAAPPTPEQLAAYSDAGVLEAEPATLIESGWAAIWLARFITQLTAPVGLRERWFLDLLTNQQHCLIGGVGIEMTPTGPAYQLTWPGQIRGWRLPEIKRD